MDTKVIGRRVGAFIIDQIIAWVAIIAASIALLERFTVPGGSVLGQDGCTLINDEFPLCLYVNNDYLVGTSGDLGILTLIGFAVWLAIRIIPQGLSGRTPGKAIFGLKVVNDHGVPPGIGRSFLREILWIVDSLPFVYLVGLITASSSRRNQRVGDMAASTLVVRSGTEGAVADTPTMTPPAAVGQPAIHPTTLAPPPGAAPVEPTPEPAQPVWDEARQTYVHTDKNGRQMVHDSATGQWRDL